MAPSATDGTLDRWYRDRVGEPATADEVTGYWLFAVGVVLGIVGVLVFLTTAPATATRQWSIVVAAAGFALLVAGPVIRLPLRRSATLLVVPSLIESMGLPSPAFITLSPPARSCTTRDEPS